MSQIGNKKEVHTQDMQASVNDTNVRNRNQLHYAQNIHESVNLSEKKKVWIDKTAINYV